MRTNSQASNKQTLLSWITFGATAMTLFLIVLFSMMQSVYTVPFAPESNRDRLICSPFMHLVSVDPSSSDNMSGAQSFRTARHLYDGLEGIEVMTVQTQKYNPVISGPTKETFSAATRRADANFFKVYDHSLIDGRYFTPEEAEALTKVAVISESTARRLFGSEQPVGNSFELNFVKYRVVGVIKDQSEYAKLGSADVVIPSSLKDSGGSWDSYGVFGEFGAVMLLKEGADIADIRRQVEQRYKDFASDMGIEEYKAMYHGAPYTVTEMTQGLYSNGAPDFETETITDMVTYALLLLIPAINLSAMLQSRLRRRMSEIGVRRAFGCTRFKIMQEIIVENLLFTLGGALVGLVAAVIVGMSCTSIYDEWMPMTETPPLSALLSVRTVVVALFAAVLLNLLSATVPAWRASRLNPSDALKA